MHMHTRAMAETNGIFVGVQRGRNVYDIAGNNVANNKREREEALNGSSPDQPWLSRTWNSSSHKF